MLYKDYLTRLARSVDSALGEIWAGYGFDYGDEYEIAVCRLLRKILPSRYGIARGHVVARDGRDKGDDIIIFDAMRMPTLAMRPREDFGRKEFIPIEAVYAYIEMKNSIHLIGDESGGQTLAKAMKQVREVKELVGTRTRVPLEEVVPGVTVGTPGASRGSLEYPSYKNPPFGLIFANSVLDRERGSSVKFKAEIEPLLDGRGLRQAEKMPVLADVVLLGNDTLLAPVPNDLMNPASASIASPFHVEHSDGDTRYSGSSLALAEAPGRATAVAIAYLLWGLDWIALGKMPWSAIIAG